MRYLHFTLILVLLAPAGHAQSPAATAGSGTTHGGQVQTGSLNVLIGGQPAARGGDTVLCPLVTPGLPPIPHVGGSIVSASGSQTVLINGLPAARVGSVHTENGPGATIIGGNTSVQIGP